MNPLGSSDIGAVIELRDSASQKRQRSIDPAASDFATPKMMAVSKPTSHIQKVIERSRMGLGLTHKYLRVTCHPIFLPDEDLSNLD